MAIGPEFQEAPKYGLKNGTNVPPFQDPGIPIE